MNPAITQTIGLEDRFDNTPQPSFLMKIAGEIARSRSHTTQVTCQIAGG
jgi:hypothetical protein